MRKPLLLLLLLACAKAQPGTHPRFDATAALQQRDFFAIPYPNDLRRTATGLDLTGFPNPFRSQLLDDYVVALRTTPGFGQASAMYVNFDGPIDPDTVTADTVQVIDLATGEKTPLQTKYYSAATYFLPANTLAAMPLYGLPLQGGHQFALVVTRGVHDANGKALEPAEGYVQDPAHARFPDAAAASVFTVQDPTQTLLALRAAVRATDVPDPGTPSCTDQGTSTLCEGTFPVPNFQTGMPPYLSGGGQLNLDADGTPVPTRIEQVRWAITLPKTAGPWPVVLYEHGTGGDYESFFREGLGPDMAGRGAAMLSMDQVLHGPRNPSCWPPTSNYEICTGTAYFDFINPYAGRDNTLQGAADGFQLIRLAQALAAPLGLDATHVAFLGHSQGGLTGAPFVAAEPGLLGAVMSGTGGTLAITVLVRKDPIDFKSVAELLVGINGKEELEPFHPVLMLIQTFAEPADPISYGRHFAREPLGGGARSIVITEGLLDPYTSAQASEALGAAAFFDIGAPVVHEDDAFVARGLSVDPLPHDVAAGSGLLLQFPNDGHYAMFDNPVARCQVESFLQAALAGSPRVDPCGG